MASKIKAAIRIRPFLPSELKCGYKNTKISVDQKKKEIYVNDEQNRKAFHFDYLFTEGTMQEEFYNGCKIDHMIDKAIEGYHSTIFAYGQTGSGKTFTMQGAESVDDNSKSELNGLIPRAVSSLFRKINAHSQTKFTVSVSFLQIYNEKIYDLLNPSSLNPKTVGSNVGGLRLRWNKYEEFSVENLFVFECKNKDEFMKYFLLGLKNRINSSHRLNMSSSRSHSVLEIRLESFHHSDPNNVICSKIELVDLAGSERIGMTGTEGKLAKESIDINKSLFTLRQVISLLSLPPKQKEASQHIPYRDSKLTSILKRSIGGNSHSLMIACLNPNDSFIEENLSTLQYANKASFIVNVPVINDDPKSKIIGELKLQITELREELKKANLHIEVMNEINGGEKGMKSVISQKINQNGNGISKALEKKESKDEENENSSYEKKNKNENYDQFSERLVESINMVRELLKSNKELREKLEESNQQLQEKDIEIYELIRENEELRESQEKNSMMTHQHFPRGQKLKSFSGSGIMWWKDNEKQNNNHKTLEINQYYQNEKGIDSMPTNFNKRSITTAYNTRPVRSRGNSEEISRGTIGASSTKKSWMSKKSQPKNLLSFYNDPSKESSFIF